MGGGIEYLRKMRLFFEVAREEIASRNTENLRAFDNIDKRCKTLEQGFMESNGEGEELMLIISNWVTVYIKGEVAIERIAKNDNIIYNINRRIDMIDKEIASLTKG